jgi:biotin carboxyl carrier protein
MKKFLIKVNGNQYEVEVEEIREGVETTSTVLTEQPPAPAAPAAPQKPVQPAQKPTANAEASVPSGATTVNAPMPGTILKVNVNSGDVVKKGQVIVILEAMKMENEILAPSDGTISSVNVTQGASVDAGDVLFSIS